MKRINILSLVVLLLHSATSQAGVFLWVEDIDPTPGLPGFSTSMIRAGSDVPGEVITGVDFYGSGADGSATARGIFGPMNQLMAGPFPTVFRDFDVFLPQPNGPLQDSRFLFATSGPGAVNSPAGFNSETGTSLRALFSRAGGFGQSVPLAQVVTPGHAPNGIRFRGAFSVLRDGVNVTLPEIDIEFIFESPLIPVDADLGDQLRGSLIQNQFSVSSSAGDVIWSDLVVNGPGSPAIAPMLDVDGKFTWDSTNSPLGAYTFDATVTDQFGDALGHLTLRLVPEPRTCSLIGCAILGRVGHIRRRS